ncbi:MAG: hypothetical protein MAG795_00148 [Candidatus Woesearchaeota archaeon]|nr:hypothetical protein [Candidatus Woesearchaeota archaeon]
MSFKEFVEQTQENYGLVRESDAFQNIDDLGAMQPYNAKALNSMPRELGASLLRQGKYRSKTNEKSEMPGAFVSWNAFFTGASLAWQVLSETYEDIPVERDHIEDYLFSQLELPLDRRKEQEEMSVADMSSNLYFADRDREGLEALTNDQGRFALFDFDADDSRVIIGGSARYRGSDFLRFRMFKDTKNAEIINGYQAVMRIAYNALQEMEK